MTVTRPDFIALQTDDLAAAATFYTERLGLDRAPSSPPGAVVFDTEPIPFAVRQSQPELDLDAGTPGLGVALWLHSDDPGALHADLVAHHVPIVSEPAPGPFGLTFTLRDPQGYLVTVHG